MALVVVPMAAMCFDHGTRQQDLAMVKWIRVAGLVILCSPLAGRGEALSLDRFPGERRSDDVLLDIGTMQAKPFLGYGWGPADRQGDHTYRWIEALDADVEGVLGEAVDGPLEVWLVAAPQYVPYTRQRFAIYINERYIGERVCPDHNGFAVYRFDVPAGLVRAGETRLRLRLGYRKQVGPDRRELSLRVDRLLLRRKDPA